jgi:putative transposase
MKYSRPISGRILTATISFVNNQWYVAINCLKSIVPKYSSKKEHVGINLGLKDSITTSDAWKSGKILLKKFDDKIARLNKELATRTSSNNRVKTITKLNKAYKDKVNYIQDKLNHITTNIVKKYGQISVGNVNSQLGLKNKKLAKTTTDQHWFEIKRQLEYKSSWYGKHFVLVDERYTSVTCSFLSLDSKKVVST